jgi:fibronectin-binding autotransporter adhesin
MKRTLIYLRTVVILAASFLTAHFASAQVTWTGGGADLNWSTADNWNNTGNPGNPPGVGDAVVFGSDVFPATTNAQGAVNNIVDAGFSAVIGSLTYNNTNDQFHTTQISPGGTLAVSGNVALGTAAFSASFVETTVVAITGTGASLNAGGVAASFQLGVDGGGAAFNNSATLDLSGIGVFSFIGTTFNVGNGNRTSGTLNMASQSNYVSVTTVNVGTSGSSNPGDLSLINLGGGTNVIYANTINIGGTKAAGTIQFAGSGGGLVVRNTAGTDRANLTLGFKTSGGTTSSTPSGSLLLAGHPVDILAGTLTLAQRTAGGSSGGALGTMVFDNGTVNVTTVQMAVKTVNNSGQTTGTLGVGGTGKLTVGSGGISLVNFTSTGDNPTGVLSITNGGQVVCSNDIVKTTLIGTGTINMNGGSLDMQTNFIGHADAPIDNFSIADSTLTVPVVSGTPSATVSNLVAGGANTVNITSVPILAGFPSIFPIIQYGSQSGTFNFNLGTAPPASPAYAGYITNDPTHGYVALVITNGPRTAKLVTWVGQIGNGDWDTFTPNWKTNGVGGAVYNDPDFARLDDTAISNVVNLAGFPLQPGSVVVSNNTRDYRIVGGGYLSGTFALDKQGSANLIIANLGNNDFSGGVNIDSGTVQIGNGDNTGSIGSGPIVNNGAIAENRDGDLEIVGDISGTGPLSKSTNGTLTLRGHNAFTGPVTIAAGALRPFSSSALGTTNGNTTIASGATLDIYGQNLGSEEIVVGGSGYAAGGYNGALVNNWSNQTQAVRFVTLTGDTIFDAGFRWDIRGNPAALLTSPPGSPYKITKTGFEQVSLVAVTNVDPGLGDIDVQQGTFSIQTTTAQLGNPSSNLIMRTGTRLDLLDLNTSPLNKVITLEDSTTVYNESGNSIIGGPVTLEGATTMDGSGSLTFNNNIDGAGGITKPFASTGTLVVQGATNSYAGGTDIQGGKFALNGNIQGSGTLTSSFGTTVVGNGTNGGSVQIGGSLRPGEDGVVGTFAGGADMTLGGDVTFDLGTNTTTGGGINDFIDTAGDLTLNSPTIDVNPLVGALQAGTYRLIHYGGTRAGQFLSDPPQIGYYTFTLDYSEANWVKLNVTAGTPSHLEWNSTSDSTWETNPNWFNQDTSTTVAFTQGDFVLFDDATPGVQTNIIIASVVYPSAVTNNASTNNYTISGGRISGLTGIVKLGTNTLTLASSNDFRGNVLVQAGILALGTNSTASNGALGTTNGATFVTNGATLDISGLSTGAPGLRNLGQEQLVVSGDGFNGQGALVSTAGRGDNAVAQVKLAGDASLGAYGVAPVGWWDIRGQNNNPSLSMLSSGGNPFKLTKVGNSRLSLFNVTVDPALGDIEIKGGEFEVGDYTTGLGNTASNLIVDAGATFQFFANNPPGATTSLWNKVFILHGDGVANTINVRGGGPHTMIGPVQLNGSCIFSGSITNRGPISGTGSLTRSGGGSLYLVGTNTYQGNTIVAAGTLALVDSGVISNSPTITVASGATLDASFRTDVTLTLFGNQTLQGSGTVSSNLVTDPGSILSPGSNSIGRLTVTGAMTLGGTNLVEIDKSNGATNDQVFAAGDVAYGGTLILSNLGPAYVAGDSFKLFNGANYTGSFTIQPAEPDTGLVWDTSSLNTDGTLKVASAFTPQPGITNIVVIGTNVIIQGTNGTTSGNYYVLASTNVTLPLSNWTVIATNAFDGGGNFNFTNGIDPAQTMLFYLLQMP